MRSRLAFALTLVLTGAPAAAFPGPATPKPGLDPKIEAQLRQALQLLAAQRLPEARDAFERANAEAGGRCFRCLEGLAAAELRLGKFEESIAAAREASKVASSPEESALALNQLGIALAARAGTDQSRLAEAESTYREAIRLSPGKPNALVYNLATVLLREGKKKEGLERLREFLAREPDGPLAAQARTLLRSPHRLGEALAPDFSVDTLSGEKLSLAALRNKVVLIDFWATWCKPCRMALPELKALKKQMAPEPFELVSFSADNALSTLKDFVAKNEMTWPQSWDEKGRLARDFSIRGYPSYVLIDPDGVIVYKVKGWSPRTGAEIASEVRKAVAKAKAAKPAARS